MTPTRENLVKMFKAKQELDKRRHIFDFPKQVIDVEFLTENYVTLLQESFRAKNLKIAHECLEALERLHFPPSLNKQANKS